MGKFNCQAPVKASNKCPLNAAVTRKKRPETKRRQAFAVTFARRYFLLFGCHAGVRTDSVVPAPATEKLFTLC